MNNTLALLFIAVFFVGSMSHAAEVRQPKNARFKQAVHKIIQFKRAAGGNEQHQLKHFESYKKECARKIFQGSYDNPADLVQLLEHIDICTQGIGLLKLCLHKD